MENKRVVSILIPYLIQDNNVLVYLQKRDKNAKRLPGYFGFFGGGRKNNENPEQTLIREIKEELNFSPKQYKLYKIYELPECLMSIFILQVDNEFEHKVKVIEGEYGKYFTETEVLCEPILIEHDKMILRDLYKFLKK